MFGQEGNDERRLPGGIPRKHYLRSVSWSDRSPTRPATNPRQQANSSKARSCLPPLQPLSIARRPVEEWPRAGSDDLGVWPTPQTPRGPIEPVGGVKSEKPEREFQFKRDKLAFFDKECSRIADHIYLGSDAVAKNRDILHQNGITHVLNCVGFVCPEYFKKDLVYKTLWLQDSPSEDITSILYDVFDYFEDVREQGGRVLVHCCQGVSRSTSLVIAYLMWRDGQSFEDAFQYVRAARGVTNPNMGFACQLIQCQKRVHAVPASPNSVLRMYRMAPHSPYDPLHLVPKMLSRPGVGGLDSRGAFVVHVPSHVFVWVGMQCDPDMYNQAKVSANQVIRYEKAQGPVVSAKEGEEPMEFWDALNGGNVPADGSADDVAAVSDRRVAEYDLDFQLFHKALSGGVVPPFSISNTRSETSLPARENGWGRLRQKFADGKVKELIVSSQLNFDPNPSTEGSDMVIDTCEEPQLPASAVENLVSLSSDRQCSSPQSVHGLANIIPDGNINACTNSEHPVHVTDDELPSPTLCGSPDSFSCIPENSLKCRYKSPTLSPSTSDYSSSSFAFSPSSSNWSDLSYLSSRQPSPSGLEASDPFWAKNAPLAEKFSLTCKEAPSSPQKMSFTDYSSSFAFSPSSSNRSDLSSRQPSPSGLEASDPFWEKKSFLAEKFRLSCKEAPSSPQILSLADSRVSSLETSVSPSRGTSRSIAERRGSNPPSLVLPAVDEPCRVPKSLVRSWSFSLPDLEDDPMICSKPLEQESCEEELILDAEMGFDGSSESEIQDKKYYFGSSPLLAKEITEVAEVATPVLYQWPTMKMIELHSGRFLDSESIYILYVPVLSLCPDSQGNAFMWLGKQALSEEEQMKLMNTPSISEDINFLCALGGDNFQNEVNLSACNPVEVIREGDEPEHFLNLLNSLSFGKEEDSNHEVRDLV